MKQLWRIALLLSAGILAAHAGSALAQAYPSKPIRIVVPFTAGGPLDIMARLIGSKMAESMNQPVLVENHPGAGGSVGANVVAKASPDGYTILINTDGLAVSPAIYRKLAFDPAKDFVPVTQLLATTQVLVAGPKVPATSTRELIALAKSKPGKLTYGHTGVGGTLHLIMEMLKLSAGIDLLDVPYKGSAQINTALMAGEVDVAVAPLSTVLQFIKNGRMRALGVTGARRSPLLPDVPTVEEAGMTAFEYDSWHGLFVPAKTPREIVNTIQREAAKAMNMPDVRERVLALGQVPVVSTPDAFNTKYKSDLAKFAKIVSDAHIAQQD